MALLLSVFNNKLYQSMREDGERGRDERRDEGRDSWSRKEGRRRERR
jgi:hypothetical protein